MKATAKLPRFNQGEATFAFQARAYKLPPFREQFHFDHVRRWRSDFAWPKHMLLVEIDGGIWREGGGAHSHPIDIERNMEKQNAATLAGYAILRFTPEQVRNGQAIAMVQRFLARTGAPTLATDSPTAANERI